MMKIDLCILTWNEIEGISELWSLIDKSLFDNIFSMDLGSTDGTLEFYKENKIPYFIQEESGRGHAFREAFKDSENDAIVFFSGDGNEDPSDLHKMVKYLNEGYDMVIGGRFIRKGSKSDNSDDMFRIRYLGNIIFSLITRLIYRTGVFDSINGYRAIKRDAMEKMKLDAPKHEIELQSTIRASKLKLKIKEFPTKELERIGGERKYTAGTFTLGWTLSKVFIRELFIRKKF
jgi:glycosyltransferase involved in cell wall biosynthesis